MKTVKRFTALVLALVMAAMLAGFPFAVPRRGQCKGDVLTPQLTLKKQDINNSTTTHKPEHTIISVTSIWTCAGVFFLHKL